MIHMLSPQNQVGTFLIKREYAQIVDFEKLGVKYFYCYIFYNFDPSRFIFLFLNSIPKKVHELEVPYRIRSSSAVGKKKELKREGQKILERL